MFLLTVLLLPAFFQLGLGNNKDMDLVFVHSIWRHGDRSQDGPLKNDPIKPSDWIKGGGGYGQLTPEGMKEHLILGKKLKKRYIDSGFISKYYDSRQIFIRSTDTNRTINSAIANMLGMFSSGGRAGIDYPDLAGWPRGFMPVPIHSNGPASEDCGASAFCKCKRRDTLLEIAHKGQQFVDYVDSENYLNTTAHVSKLFNTTFSWKNLWQLHDAILIQKIHFPKTLRNQSWYSDAFYENLDYLERWTKIFVSGLYDPPVVNGINVRQEILKTRGGPILNEILERMKAKVDCVKLKNCDSWYRNLKYYAYSTHDHTVFALLAVLGLENVVAGPEKYGQWPDYAADILIELYQNRTDKKSYFKVLYLKNAQSSFKSVTEMIPGCEGLPYCPLKVLESRAKTFKPEKPMKKWCLTAPQAELPTWMKHLLRDETGSAVSQDYLAIIAMMVALV